MIITRHASYRSVLIAVASFLAATQGHATGGDQRANAAQQQDPKAREIKAEVMRSLENETVTLKATFPDDIPGVKVSLFNLLGKLIEVHPVTLASKGSNLFQFRTKGLPNGPYIVVLEAAGQRLINKVMLSR